MFTFGLIVLIVAEIRISQGVGSFVVLKIESILLQAIN